MFFHGLVAQKALNMTERTIVQTRGDDGKMEDFSYFCKKTSELV